MSRTRRRFTAEQKAQIVRRHLAGKEPVSKLSEEFGLQPSQIHTWVNQVLAQADKAFERPAENGRTEKAKDRRIEQLQAKLATKNEVIAELLEEKVAVGQMRGAHRTSLGRGVLVIPSPRPSPPQCTGLRYLCFSVGERENSTSNQRMHPREGHWFAMATADCEFGTAVLNRARRVRLAVRSHRRRHVVVERRVVGRRW